jgi:hypothetical protein
MAQAQLFGGHDMSRVCESEAARLDVVFARHALARQSPSLSAQSHGVGGSVWLLLRFDAATPNVAHSQSDVHRSLLCRPRIKPLPMHFDPSLGDAFGQNRERIGEQAEISDVTSRGGDYHHPGRRHLGKIFIGYWSGADRAP